MFKKSLFVIALLIIVSLSFAATTTAQEQINPLPVETAVYNISGEVLAGGIVDLEVVEGVGPCMIPRATKVETDFSDNILSLEFKAEAEATEAVTGVDVDGLDNIEKFELKSDEKEEDLYEVKVETEGAISSLEVGDTFEVDVAV